MVEHWYRVRVAGAISFQPAAKTPAQATAPLTILEHGQTVTGVFTGKAAALLTRTHLPGDRLLIIGQVAGGRVQVDGFAPDVCSYAGIRVRRRSRRTRARREATGTVRRLDIPPPPPPPQPVVPAGEGVVYTRQRSVFPYRYLIDEVRQAGELLEHRLHELVRSGRLRDRTASQIGRDWDTVVTGPAGGDLGWCYRMMRPVLTGMVDRSDLTVAYLCSVFDARVAGLPVPSWPQIVSGVYGPMGDVGAEIDVYDGPSDISVAAAPYRHTGSLLGERVDQLVAAGRLEYGYGVEVMDAWYRHAHRPLLAVGVVRDTLEWVTRVPVPGSESPGMSQVVKHYLLTVVTASAKTSAGEASQADSWADALKRFAPEFTVWPEAEPDDPLFTDRATAAAGWRLYSVLERLYDCDQLDGNNKTLLFGDWLEYAEVSLEHATRMTVAQVARMRRFLPVSVTDELFAALGPATGCADAHRLGVHPGPAPEQPAAYPLPQTTPTASPGVW